MSVTGPGSITAANALAQTNMMNQLNTLSQQLGTGQAAQTYSGLTSQAGLALQLNAQLSAIDGYSQTASTVGTTLTVAQSVLTQLGSTQSSVKQSLNQQLAFSLNNNGQTTEQQTAATQLDQILSLLNTQSGNTYLFSGSAVNQPSVADTSEILDGNGVQAGLIQVISEREQADLGTNGLGRLVIPAASGSTVSMSEDVAGSPFGLKLAGASSTLTGATVTGPSGSPPTLSVSLGSDPNDGDTIQFAFTMPDGTTQNIALHATSSTTPGTNQFSIVSGNTAATATNLQAALTTAVTNLAQTALPASSAIAAANNFFTSDPPQRVDPGSPANFATATSLVNGTTANTVFWYTGENGSTPARQTATARVGPSMTISYGMRANEQAISSLVANVAVLAATTYSASNPNAQASYQALCQQVTANLNGTPGTQSVSDIEADLANAQTTASNAASLNTQTQTTLTNLLQGIDGVNQNQIGEEILTLQNSLSASMSLTARLAQLSLVNYLAPVSG
jgi:flagellar hook-associated protein 3 FlgL